MAFDRQVVAVCLLLAAPFASAEAATWGLSWKAPPECVQRAELAQRVEARIGRAVFGPSAAMLIDGALESTQGATAWRARLTLTDANGAVQGSREVESKEADCRAIDDSLVLVLAVMIDPAASLRSPPPVAQVLPAPPPPPPTSVLAPPPPPRPPEPETLLVEHGHVYQGPNQLDRGDFYRLIGRPDLDARMSRRLGGKIAAFTVGGLALGTGTTLLIAHAGGAGCTLHSGSTGACVEQTYGLLAAGITSLVVGVTLILLGSLLPREPTTVEEDQQLVDTYNRQLRAPGLVPTR